MSIPGEQTPNLRNDNEATALQIMRIAQRLGVFSFPAEGQTTWGPNNGLHFEQGRVAVECRTDSAQQWVSLIGTSEGFGFALGHTKPHEEYLRFHIGRTRRVTLEALPAQNPRYGTRRACVTSEVASYRQSYQYERWREEPELTTPQIRDVAAGIFREARRRRRQQAQSPKTSL